MKREEIKKVVHVGEDFIKIAYCGKIKADNFVGYLDGFVSGSITGKIDGTVEIIRHDNPDDYNQQIYANVDGKINGEFYGLIQLSRKPEFEGLFNEIMSIEEAIQ